MSQRRIGWIVAAGMAVLGLASPAVSSGATMTVITIDVNNVTETETFTATGGVVCASGMATTDFHHFGGGPRAGSFHLTKTLDCDDESGTFTIVVNAATVFGSPTDQGGWAVLDGTGAYEHLRGGGMVVGTYVDTGIIDVYSGSVRR